MNMRKGQQNARKKGTRMGIGAKDKNSVRASNRQYGQRCQTIEVKNR